MDSRAREVQAKPAPPNAGTKHLERFRFRRNHTKGRALRCTSSTGSVKVGIALGAWSTQAQSGIFRTRHTTCSFKAGCTTGTVTYPDLGSPLLSCPLPFG